MAMSRFLSQSLLPRASLRSPAPLIAQNRSRSSKARRGGQLIEADLDAASDSPDAAAEFITVGIKKLEEAIQTIIVLRAAPDWLPFLPGYSYWVPPHHTSLGNSPAQGVIEAIGRLKSSSPGTTTRNRIVPRLDLSEDERMSLTSTKGWPSYAFYIEGTSPMHPIEVLEVEVKVPHGEDDIEGATSTSEDEEG